MNVLSFKHFTQEEMLALMAANSPNPDEEYIALMMELDTSANPHNDPYPKPPRRSRAEIVADYKIEHAFALMNRLMSRVRC